MFDHPQVAPRGIARQTALLLISTPPASRVFFNTTGRVYEVSKDDDLPQAKQLGIRRTSLGKLRRAAPCRAVMLQQAAHPSVLKLAPTCRGLNSGLRR